MREQIARAFGPHSKRIWRCIVGATWSLPLRYVTLYLQVAAMAAVLGVSWQVPLTGGAVALSAGVAVGWAIRLADNLVNEYLIFPAVKSWFVKD
jgi:hypothetical protein